MIPLQAYRTEALARQLIRLNGKTLGVGTIPRCTAHLFIDAGLTIADCGPFRESGEDFFLSALPWDHNDMAVKELVPWINARLDGSGYRFRSAVKQFFHANTL